MRKKIFIPILFFLFLVPIVTAEKTVKTITYFGGFVADALANTPYSKIFTFKAPDGISSLYYAKGTITADMTTINTRVYMQVDGEFCDPNYYDVPTNTKRYTMEFDCTGVAHGEGQYEAGFQATNNIENVYAEWEFTYLNDPSPIIASIGGTEYQTGEPSRIVLQILDNEGAPINDGDCFTTVRNSNDTIVVDNQSLSYINESNGLYFHEFMVELPTGVYSTDNYCSLGGINVYSGDTFHVAPWAEDIANIYNISTSAFIGFVGATEYTKDETVNLRVQYLKAGTDGGTPISNECCDFNLFAPNLTQIFTEQAMTYISGSRGLYYYDWDSSKDYGVYSMDVKCYSCSNPNSWRAHSGSTFHVWSGNVSATNIADVNYTWFQERFEHTWVNQSTILEAIYNITCEDNVTCEINYTYFDEQFGYVFENQTNIHDFINYVNASIFGKLHSLQDDFNATWVNQTKIWELLVYMNSTGVDINYTYFDEQFNLVFVNQTEIHDTLISHNDTVMWKLYAIQDEITSVNDTIKSETTTIINNQWMIYNWLQGFNATVHNWFQTTWNNQIWWGNYLYDYIYWHHWEIENKIDSIILGNVTVHTDFDCDKMGLCVMQYLMALEKMRVV